MTDNRLESFRQRLGRGDTVLSAGAHGEVRPNASEEYQAFGQEHPELRGEIIEVRYGDGAWCQIERRFLVRVEGAGNHFLALVCTNYAVLIEGQGLSDLRRRLGARKLDFIQEYDQQRWPIVLTGVPVVDKVEIISADGPLANNVAQRRPA